MDAITRQQRLQKAAALARELLTGPPEPGYTPNRAARRAQKRLQTRQQPSRRP